MVAENAEFWSEILHT